MKTVKEIKEMRSSAPTDAVKIWHLFNIVIGITEHARVVPRPV